MCEPHPELRCWEGQSCPGAPLAAIAMGKGSYAALLEQGKAESMERWGWASGNPA